MNEITAHFEESKYSFPLSVDVSNLFKINPPPPYETLCMSSDFNRDKGKKKIFCTLLNDIFLFFAFLFLMTFVFNLMN